MSHLKVLAESVAATGVKYIFGVPGSGPSLTLIEELERLGVKFIRVYHEQTAAVMAGTFGRLTGKPYPALCIKGPGLANMLPGIALCHMENFPMIVISESYIPGTPANKAHKRLNHASLAESVVNEVCYWDGRSETLQGAVDKAMSGTMGPVLLNIAGAAIETGTSIEAGTAIESTATGEAGGVKKTELSTSTGDSTASTNDPDTFHKLIEAASKPVVIAGIDALCEEWQQQLDTLAIPVFTTAAAKGAVNEENAFSAGVYTGVGQDLSPEKQLLPDADLIIGIGLRHSEVLNAAPFHCPSVNIDSVGYDSSLHSGFAFKAVVTPGQLAIDSPGRLARGTWQSDCVSNAVTELRNHLLTDKFLPANAFEIIAKHFNNSARIVMDTGLFCTVGEHIVKARTSESCLFAGQARYMGSGIPMALAASLYDKSIPTIAVIGDGGVGMSFGEVKLAAQYNLPILFMLMSDSKLGTIRTRVVKDQLSESAVDIALPSWLDAFQGAGVRSYSARTADEITIALNAWQPEDGPAFCELSFDADDYVQMCDGIR